MIYTQTIIDNIRESHGRLCSILTAYDDIDQGLRTVFFHTFDIDPTHFDRLVEKFYGIGGLLYVADLSRGFRKIL